MAASVRDAPHPRSFSTGKERASLPVRLNVNQRGWQMRLYMLSDFPRMHGTARFRFAGDGRYLLAMPLSLRHTVDERLHGSGTVYNTKTGAYFVIRLTGTVMDRSTHSPYFKTTDGVNIPLRDGMYVARSLVKYTSDHVAEQDAFAACLHQPESVLKQRDNSSRKGRR